MDLQANIDEEHVLLIALLRFFFLVVFSIFPSLCSPSQIITCSRDQTTSTDTAMSTCACIGQKLVSRQHRRRRHAVERSVANLCWSEANVGPEAVYRIDGLISGYHFDVAVD